MFRITRNILFRSKYGVKTKNSICAISSTNEGSVRSITSLRNNPNQFRNDVKSHHLIQSFQPKQFYSSESTAVISHIDYEHFCAETLESVGDYFEELVESTSELETADVLNKDGVLTVCLGDTHGTYVINKQSPNKQIWLSSPVSGPKRFDFIYAADGSKTGYWFYKHTGETIHEILDREIGDVMGKKTDFQSLAFGSRC